MKFFAQRGIVLPEVLAALAVAGLAVGLVGSFAGVRIDAERIRAQQAEARHVASLVERAHRQGLLVEHASTAADLQAALPDVAVPTRLGGGPPYRIALDGADPRVLVDTATRLRDGSTVTRTEVVRAPLPVSELRIPFWRALRLRRIREGTE